MAKFESRVEKTANGQKVYFTGSLDEDSTLPVVTVAPNSRLEVDFKAVDGVNSCGVREWVKWLGTIPESASIVYINCPKIIVDQVNMVGGLLRKGVKVESFETPFFCENCSLQTNVLFSAGKEFTNANPEIPVVKCQKCQGPTEVDVMEAKYFKFLARQF